MTEQPDVTLQLSGDAALVLDAALSKPEDIALRVKEPAEQVAVCELAALLERELVVPFSPDYDGALQAARMRLTARGGVAEGPSESRSSVVPATGHSTASETWTCCFCGSPLIDDASTTAEMQLVGDDAASQTLRSHRSCLRRHLHPSVPLLSMTP